MPGDRPGRFVRAEESGADVVVFDLEDAVGSSSKEDALAHVAAHLQQPEGRPARIVRINDPGTARGLDDLAALPVVEASFGVMVPKATPESVSRARDRRHPLHRVVNRISAPLGGTSPWIFR